MHQSNVVFGSQHSYVRLRVFKQSFEPEIGRSSQEFRAGSDLGQGASEQPPFGIRLRGKRVESTQYPSIAELDGILPDFREHWGRGVWPFFMPLIVPHAKDKVHYLAEDWAFSYRLAQVGVTPLADTSVRLWHWGRYGFSWEDAGSDVKRYRSYSYELTGR